MLVEHPPTVTAGRRTAEDEIHLPAHPEIDVVQTNRGGRSTYHGPGQLVCYPILDLNRHGRDVKRHCRSLEQVAIGALAAFGLDGMAIDGLTGVWIGGEPPRKIASIGVHVFRWVTTHGLALNVDLDPAPFSEWITACGLGDAQFTAMARELGRSLTVAEVRPQMVAAVEQAFGLALDELPAQDGAGLWPQPLHAKMSA
jgi:lipoyl(octanoyl) transferase